MIERAQYIVASSKSDVVSLQAALPLTATRTVERGHQYIGGHIARESVLVYEVAVEGAEEALWALLDYVAPLQEAVVPLIGEEGASIRIVLSSVQAHDGGLTLSPALLTTLGEWNAPLTVLRHETDSVVYLLQHWAATDTPAAVIGTYSDAASAREQAIEQAQQRGGYGVHVTRIVVDDATVQQSVGWADRAGFWSLLEPSGR
jgi:hypothetical protein